jgi:hypothetical protein
METFCPIQGSPPGAKSGAMLRRLRERKLLKQVFKDPIGKPYDARHWELLKGLPKRKSDDLAKTNERRVAEFLNSELELKNGRAVDPDYTIAHSYGIKSARESSRNDEEGILVSVKPSPQHFTDESTLFKSINEAYADNFIVIFAPIQWPNPIERDDLRGRWADPIRKLIQEECKKVKP